MWDLSCRNGRIGPRPQQAPHSVALVNDPASSSLDRGALARWGFDFPAGRALPRTWRFMLATVLAVLLSLAACAALVVVGTAVFPATAGYGHYQFADYSKLTIIGVVIASFGWPAACYV